MPTWTTSSTPKSSIHCCLWNWKDLGIPDQCIQRTETDINKANRHEAKQLLLFWRKMISAPVFFVCHCMILRLDICFLQLLRQ
jgi:hypothetical protein